MNERIQKLADKIWAEEYWTNPNTDKLLPAQLNKFAELIVGECINKIETYRIPVGNSAAGEMACEWTYDALKEIRDDIKETFGVQE
jgi:hypothetical protein